MIKLTVKPQIMIGLAMMMSLMSKNELINDDDVIDAKDGWINNDDITDAKNYWFNNYDVTDAKK